MKVVTGTIRIHTKGAGDLRDITPDISRLLASSGFTRGTLTVFVPGSTAGVTTFEYEPGLTQDMREFYQRLVPQNARYHHDDTWHDANGFSHVRAALTGPSLTVPFQDSTLMLGTWQQVVLAEFDNRPRHREIIVQVIGE